MNIFRFRAGAVLVLALGLSAPAVFLTGCSNADQREVEADASTSYNDFRAYVEGVERDAQSVDLSDTEFSAEMNRVKADYDAKLAIAERDADQFTAEQRADLVRLKARYSAAFGQREAAYRSRAASSPAPSGAGRYQPAAAGYAALPAASLRATYEQFVQNVKANEDRYGIEDWQAVNADWQALNARKDQVENELSIADRAEIAKEKIKYAAFKTFDKGEARAAQGADETKSGAYRAGQVIGHGAHKAGKVIERGAEKVGAATKEVYKGVRDASKEEAAANRR